jgi:hypothetical protein
MDARVEQVGRFLILLFYVALPHDAPEADLDVLARTAEPVIKIKVPEGSVEVVAPHQADRAFAQPNALGARRRAGHDPAGFGNLIEAPGAVLAGLALAWLGRLRVCILGLQRGRRERCRAEKNRKGTPNNTDHDRTSVFRSGLTGTGLCSGNRVVIGADRGPISPFVNGRSYGVCPAANRQLD